MTASDTSTAGTDTRCFPCSLGQCTRCAGSSCTHTHRAWRSYPEPEDQSAEENR